MLSVNPQPLGPMNAPELSIVMPCLNESETLKVCIQKAFGFLQEHSIDGEVIIADNGSTDGSQSIALENGAVLIEESQPGYGAAILAGLRGARGRYLIIGDADDSYDLPNSQPSALHLWN